MAEVDTREIIVEVILESKIHEFPARQLDVTMESPASEVLAKVAPGVREATEGNVSIVDEDGNSDYEVRFMTQDNKIVVLPKGEAGTVCPRCGYFWTVCK